VPIASLHAGCDLRDVRPIDAIARIDGPILFIHARDDTLIPISQSERLQQAAPGAKDVFITERGGHSSSLHASRDKYLEFARHILSLPRPALATTAR
jgi:fermentation-respiration switch protein FrsA (DUF1100 family)